MEKNNKKTEKNLILKPKDFEQMLGEKLSPFIKDKVVKYGLTYQKIDQDERDSWIRKMVATLLDKYLIFSGKHRHEHWEKGWQENLNEVLNKKGDVLQAILPKYFNKYPVVRLNEQLVRPITKDFEFKILGLILDWLFDQYIRNAKAVYEFGCGTGYNLFRARHYNQEADMWGLDWALSSKKIIDHLREKGLADKFFGHQFDYFHPDKNFKLKENSVVYTVASLEQIGDKYTKFVDYLIKNKPRLCIHVEPIGELLAENKLLDFLSIEYFKKRKYLSGYLTYLKKLEKTGKINIIRAQRSYTGSLFIEGHSIIVWAPKQ